MGQPQNAGPFPKRLSSAKAFFQDVFFLEQQTFECLIPFTGNHFLFPMCELPLPDSRYCWCWFHWLNCKSY